MGVGLLVAEVLVVAVEAELEATGFVSPVVGFVSLVVDFVSLVVVLVGAMEVDVTGIAMYKILNYI